MSKAYDDMTTAEKRAYTIKQRYGSHSKMLEQTRPVANLILAGYNGGIIHGKKGFATVESSELSLRAKSRSRNAKGQFVNETPKDSKNR